MLIIPIQGHPLCIYHHAGTNHPCRYIWLHTWKYLHNKHGPQFSFRRKMDSPYPKASDTANLIHSIWIYFRSGLLGLTGLTDIHSLQCQSYKARCPRAWNVVSCVSPDYSKPYYPYLSSTEGDSSM